LTDDFKGLEKDCKRGKGDDAIPASLADRLANRKPLGDVDTNAGGLPGPGQHHGTLLWQPSKASSSAAMHDH